ncbi:lysozyme inhibitor LprI family protein [Pseudomonas sp. LFM046]|uniref:lysozyme inhibitor LprI family protein n=1 Tax=Pseudomonas sp. LFM046 TaxID=1608357 RepID=UPI0009E47E75|nr:lysozyme inhibitor LprI family protein [Pseudomonas sp. LFM046]
MQLLVKICLALSVIKFGSAFAGEKCQSESTKKEDILKCVAISHAIVDGMLNDRYRAIIGDKGFKYKDLLVEGERLWINYRESRCKYIYDSIYPGAEAEIERGSCVLSLTYSRLLELIYIESSVKEASFERFLGGVKELERDSVKKAYDSLDMTVIDIDGGKYFSKNCELINALYGEDEAACIERMKIQNL